MEDIKTLFEAAISFMMIPIDIGGYEITMAGVAIGTGLMVILLYFFHSFFD